MTKIINPLILLSFTACSDPCTWTWWGEKAVETYNEKCKDEDGETGGETGGEEINDDTDLLCPTGWNYNEELYDPIDFDAQYCMIGGPGDEPGEATDPNGWTYKKAGECHTLAGPVPCNRSWSSPWTSNDECVICEVPLGPEYVEQPDWGSSWPICWHTVLPNTYWKYGIPDVVTDAAVTQASATWFVDEMECAISSSLLEPCEVVGMTPSAKYDPDEIDFRNGEWTCACEDDSDCQAGAVCEAGWTYSLNGYHPTLCTWDDPQGTSNGVAPEGPVVYGAADWSSVVVDGTRITVTSEFVAAAIIGAGLWNDDQRVDVELGADGETFTATITRCGPDSLCAHLGLRDGLVLAADFDIGEGLAAGEGVAFAVIDETGISEQWTVAVAED